MTAPDTPGQKLALHGTDVEWVRHWLVQHRHVQAGKLVADSNPAWSCWAPVSKNAERETETSPRPKHRWQPLKKWLANRADVPRYSVSSANREIWNHAYTLNTCFNRPHPIMQIICFDIKRGDLAIFTCFSCFALFVPRVARRGFGDRPPVYGPRGLFSRGRWCDDSENPDWPTHYYT